MEWRLTAKYDGLIVKAPSRVDREGRDIYPGDGGTVFLLLLAGSDISDISYHIE